MALGVTFPSFTRLSPVTRVELLDYCHETLTTLNILSKSAASSDDILLRYEDDASTQALSQNDQALIERTPLWKNFLPAFNYAELGAPLDLKEDEIEYLLTELAQWLCATFSYREFNGNPIWSGEKVIYKFIARLKLDYQWDVSEKFAAIESGWYPDAHEQHLSILDIALLAGMENIRSVRNATYDKLAPLETIKEGGKVLVTVKEARRWLQERKGFIPTQGISYVSND